MLILQRTVREKEGGGGVGAEQTNKQKTGGGGGSEGSRKDWEELYGCIK